MSNSTFLVSNDEANEVVTVLAGCVLFLTVLTVVVLMMCGVLHIYDWCVDNNKQIQREAIQIQIAGDVDNVNHLPNSFDQRPTIEI